MKNLIITAILFSLIFSGCDLIIGETVRGNGNIISANRQIASANKIKLAGGYDVVLVKGPGASLKIEADDNLMSHIITQNEGGWLVIKSKNHERLVSDTKIKIYITTDVLEAVELAGSGDINGKDKFTGGDHLEIKIAGSGNLDLDINTPSVKAEIAGSGNITLSGETRSQLINIAGHGDYRAENLKAENAEIHIAGSGDVKVFADNKLDVHIAGSGTVYYKGNPSISQHIAGSGEIKQLQ